MSNVRTVRGWSCEKWDFIGRNLEISEKGRYDEKCDDEGIHDSQYIPLINYAYPLEHEAGKKEIKEVHERTNLTVVRNIREDDYYLALCGAGMDFSQDIAMAYLICEGYIPCEWAEKCYTGQELTQHGTSYVQLLEGCKRALQHEHRIEEIDRELSRYKDPDENGE